MPKKRHHYWKTTKPRQSLPVLPVIVSDDKVLLRPTSLSPIPPTPLSNDGLVAESSYFGDAMDGDPVDTLSTAQCSTSSASGPSERRNSFLSIQVSNDVSNGSECNCRHPSVSEITNTTATLDATIPTVQITPTSPVTAKSENMSSSPTKRKVAPSRSSPLSVDTSSGSLSGIPKSPGWFLRMRMTSGRRATSLDSLHSESDHIRENRSPSLIRPRSLCSPKSLLSRKGAEPRISESAEFMNGDESACEFEPPASGSPTILVSSTSSTTQTEKPNRCDGVKDDGDVRQWSASPTSSFLEYPVDCCDADSSLEVSPPSSRKPVRGRVWYVMAEIVDTERAYVADLKMLHDVYLVEFMRDTSLGLTQEQRESVVLNVPDLLAVHKPFVQSLEAVAKEHGITGSMDVEVNGPATEKLAVDAIALCFLKVVLQFDGVYRTFCSGHAEAAAIIRNIQHIPAFVAFEKTCASMAANPSTYHSSLMTLTCEEDAEENSKDRHASTSPNRQSSIAPTTPSNDPSPSKPQSKLSKSSLNKRASSISLKCLSFAISSGSPSKSAPPSPNTKTQALSSSLSSSRSSVSMRWRRSSPEIPVQSQMVLPDTPEANDVPPVPPVPPLTPPESPSPSGVIASTSKRLAFRDLLIKPVQRVCRYPLLLEQMRSGPVPKEEIVSTGSLNDQVGTSSATLEDLLLNALMATKKVAQDVDKAREKRDNEIKTRLIIDRLDATSTLSPDFVSSLGSVRLASSLDMIYHHPLLAPLGGIVKVRYCGAFVYDGYLLLMKVRKNKNFLPLHWLPLENVEVVNDDDGRGLLPHSFKAKVREHTLELGASCSGEKDVWLRAIATSRTVPLQADSFLQRSSLQIIEDQHAPPTEPGTSAPRKRRQSLLASAVFSVSSSNTPSQAVPSTLISPLSSKDVGLAGSSTARPAAPDVESKSVSIEAGALTKMERQWTMKRTSIGKRSSLFSLDGSSTSYRRVAATERLMADRTLTDIWSSECITLRTQAQLRGELFSQTKAVAQEFSDKGSWSKASSFSRRSLTLVTGGSSASASYAPVRRQSAPPSSPHRLETFSIPRNSSEPDKLNGHSPTRKGTAVSERGVELAIRDPDNPGYAVWRQDVSDDDTEAFWDDVVSSNHTEPTSEETQDVGDGRLHTKAMSHTDGKEVHIPEYELSYVGEGIANQPLPRQESSFLQRSLTAVTRRRTKSTPSKVPHFLTEDGSRKPLQTTSIPEISSRNRRANDSLLSPYWTKAPVVARPASSVNFGPSPVVLPFLDTTLPPLLPPLDTQGESRSAIDLCRLEPDPNVVCTARKITVSTSSSSSTASQSAGSIQSLFQYRNKFTSIS